MVWDFENKCIEGIPMSRFIASWSNEGGSFDYHDGGMWQFQAWLRGLTVNGRKITEDEIKMMRDMATDGKLELEILASRFMAENPKENFNKRKIKNNSGE